MPTSRRKRRRDDQHGAKNDSDNTCRQSRCEKGAKQGANGRRNLQKHADSNVRESLTHVSGGRAGRGGDHGYQRGADGIVNIHVKDHHQQGHDDHAAPQPGECAEQAGQQRAQQDQKNKSNRSHRNGMERCAMKLTSVSTLRSSDYPPLATKMAKRITSRSAITATANSRTKERDSLNWSTMKS